MKEALSAEDRSLRVGIVANEVSGDILAAGLMRELQARIPDVVFEGIAGPRMLEQGCHPLYPIEEISVMGLVEVLSHLPKVLSIRRHVRNHFINNPPDLFVGVDAPDFNLSLERDLKNAGISTVHYVCPSVWAWRSGRVDKIRASVDMVLSLFPFEMEFLRQHSVPSVHVGHPLADVIPLVPDKAGARERLGLDSSCRVIAMLPGSRASEIRYLSEDFIKTAQLCWEKDPQIRFVVPLVNRRIWDMFHSILKRLAPDLPIILLDGNSQDAFQAADAVLLASGTATLEGLLYKRPMVVAYRMHWLTYWILTRFKMIKSPFVSLANMLAGREIAPEILQDDVQPQTLSQALMQILASPESADIMQEIGDRVHRELRLDASSRAADVVLELMAAKREKGL